ncbi:hypothetical protein KKG45_14180 [bacterium]|nr:hypothetical protein [bacterium]MBU1074385.1 hypothetical protein [bacterium]MBU1674840.1 hypothetical protein [bacterium]
MKKSTMYVQLIAILAICIPAASALATTEDFDGLPAGTVVAGQEPGGGTAPGTVFADFTLSVTNNGGGPHSLIIFDSDDPTGWDQDLGTPNVDFGGPGVGSGGSAGAPGENSVPYHNLLICAEDIVDANSNGLVDDPDDEAGGCTVVFDFDFVVDLSYIVIVDIDFETVDFDLYEDGAHIGGDEGVDLGNNSVQVVDLTPFSSIDRLEVEFSSSGAIAELEFFPAAVADEDADWGGVKRIYR